MTTLDQRAVPPADDAIAAIVARLMPGADTATIRRVEQGVSTFVYRVRRREEAYYLRVLPEIGDSFAPEARAHGLARARGARVPDVLVFDDRDPVLGLSVMITAELPGRPLGQRGVDEHLERILFEAGRDLATLHGIPVEGFGWVRREPELAGRLIGEHKTSRAFIAKQLDDDLSVLASGVLSWRTIEAIRETIGNHRPLLDAEAAWLAHGDFDVSHIFERDGRYMGIIDFGELRGASPLYDLGHFRAHDGETLPQRVLPWLMAGYRDVAPLPGDAAQRIRLYSLLLTTYWLARLAVRRHGDVPPAHPAFAAIARELATLRV